MRERNPTTVESVMPLNLRRMEERVATCNAWPLLRFLRIVRNKKRE